MQQNWAFSNSYEQSSLTSPLFFFTLLAPQEPDQGVGFTINIGCETVAQEFYKQNNSVPSQPQIQAEPSTGTEPIFSEEPSLEQNDETHISNNPSQTSSKGRQDDNNNAHKHFITTLNNNLKKNKLLETMKKMLKNEQIKFNKGSRYSFVLRLIDIKRLLKQKMEEEKLQTILNEYCQDIQKEFQLPASPKPADRLKHALIAPYQEAVQLFLQGKQIEATERIYDIEGAKQNKYKGEGVRKVKDYLAKLAQQGRK